MDDSESQSESQSESHSEGSAGCAAEPHSESQFAVNQPSRSKKRGSQLNVVPRTSVRDSS